MKFREYYVKLLDSIQMNTLSTRFAQGALLVPIYGYFALHIDTSFTEWWAVSSCSSPSALRNGLSSITLTAWGPLAELLAKDWAGRNAK